MNRSFSRLCGRLILVKSLSLVTNIMPKKLIVLGIFLNIFDTEQWVLSAGDLANLIEELIQQLVSVVNVTNSQNHPKKYQFLILFDTESHLWYKLWIKGFYRGNVVALKKVYKRSVDLTRTIKKELKLMREVKF